MTSIPQFDSTKFYLGKLCPRNHEFEATGKTLRRKNKRTCPKCETLGRARWEARNPEKNKQQKRIKDLKRLFNLTPEQYDAILSEQGGVCSICKTPPKGKHLAVDHCHTTGEIRGLLCNDCNIGLGYFQDNPDYLLAAITYLTHYKNMARIKALKSWNE